MDVKSKKSEKPNYKDTLNLPKTGFSMKANLPQREPETLKKWTDENLYESILEKRKDSEKTFILHDGPPYANGHIHVGHALNKTLKDMCIKYFTMLGYKAPYVPGWDCHGLPVEHQLFKELNITKHDIDKVIFRKKAYKYASKFVKIQAEEFKRLGILGEWDNPYLTLTKDYEADILDSLAELYEKGYIYKGLKPVNWCSSCETALAEAEVEYEDKESPSIYVKFETKEKLNGKSTFFAVWTTTPWTLIANVAVAVHPDFRYAAVETDSEVLIFAEDLVKPLMEKTGTESHAVLETLLGKDIPGRFKDLKHPFIDRQSQLVLADYVTKEDGTGCVHIAPGHGQEDYIVGKKYFLPVIMPVDDKGKFSDEAGDFEGKGVIESNPLIIDTMKKLGTLIFSETVMHSYPHCWRCKEPIIFRATEQWFMNVDHNDLRSKIKDAIKDDVKWTPERGEERIASMVEGRPDWCLSRQRFWGVPIPSFKCASCGETFTNAEVIKRAADFTREEGSNVWFEKEVSDLLPQGSVCGGCGKKEFEKEEDILDVWFDSGVSHRAVLKARKNLKFPADLYLEGSDQHRGWFQSALITSMANEGKPPYKEVLTHGFVVDGEGKKMSKSLGNVIKPQEVIKKYGADILRLWVASSDYDGDIKLSDEILDRLADGYRKMRNTFRFLLSNLYDFDANTDMLETASLTEMDKWMLSQLSGLVTRVTGYYDKWEFHRVYREVYDFCVYEVSSFYLDVLKDTLYILKPDSEERRSHQTTIFNILSVLDRLMAPIMPFTADEVWSYIEFPGKAESVHMADWPGISGETDAWTNKELDGKWKKILVLRDKIMKALELERENGIIGSSMEALVVMHSDDKNMKEFIMENKGILPGIFKVSKVSVIESKEDGMSLIEDIKMSVKIKKAEGEKCARCWNYAGSVGTNKDFQDLCERCYNILAERR
ncbi:MAG: isoleucine--tRNA ligase [Candidatus Aadella gelida]|nr:isoleucine--tRNA ligase [Candidatus Aadella gelida]